jgi:transposase, IS30 family
MRPYHQLTREQRYQIYALRRMGHSGGEIAQVIGVHKSTVSREVRRNRGRRGYRPQLAQHLAQARKPHCRMRIAPERWRQVEQLLRQDWSPEQIVGRLRREGQAGPSHTWIYRYVWQDHRTGGDLAGHLRCRKQKRKHYGGVDRRGIWPRGRSIEERPALVDARQRLGDWEADTLLGRNLRVALLTLTERKSRFTLLGFLPGRSAGVLQQVLLRLLTPFGDKLYTLTSDHGKEFSHYQAIAQALRLDYYFAHPYAAGERGTNENTNGLLRQYFPRGRDLQSLSRQDLQHAQDRLNFRPRKCLAFRTPFEVFFEQAVALTT